MRLLAEKTTIPLPRVFELDTGMDNEIGCPFMFMDWLPGVPLLDLWDRFVSKQNIFDDTLVRVNLIKELATVMVQLEFGRYRRGGTPSFTPEGEFLEIGPLITRDLGIESFENLPDLIGVGPLVDHFDFMTWKIERAHTRAEEDPEYNLYKMRDDQARTVYGMLVTWMDDSMNDQKDFILAHTDFGPQNVIVDPESGTLTGIIDFDGITAVPRYLSNGYRGSYPHWLTRDQDLYEDPDNDTASFPVNSEEYDYWRAIWRFFVNEAHINRSTSPWVKFPRSRQSWTEIPRTYAQGLTPAYSLDARIMSLAGNDPINSLPKIVHMILKKIIHLSENYPYLFRTGNDYDLSQSETALSNNSNPFIQDPMTMGQILVPTTATTRAAADLMDEIALDMNSLDVSTEPVSPSELESSIESIFDTQSLPEGFRRFKTTTLLQDAAENRLCQADHAILHGWFLFLFAGQDHSGRVVEGYCDDTEEGEASRAQRRDERHPLL